MARIVIGNHVYEELAPGSMIEADFENIVVGKREVIFPNFHVIPFKSPVFSEEACAMADLALVGKSYREWWVVEVELGNHSLDGHVLPQVRALASASYGPDEGRAMCMVCPDLDRACVLDMLKGKQPRVLVVVNADKGDWIRPLRRYDAELLVLQVFRSERNEYAFRIEGHMPTASAEGVSECEFDYLVPRFLEVHSPALLGIVHGERVSIRYGTYATEWQRVDCQDKVWLAPARQNPLPRNKSYLIIRSADGNLEFIENARRLPRRA